MWYDAWNGTVEQARIGHATSADGISWTRDPANPLLSFGSLQNWDYPRVDLGSVIYDGNTFHMWYDGGGFFTWKIGYATSQDGSSWTKYASNPLMDWGTAGSWDDRYVALPSVIFDPADSVYKMWYTGGNGDWDGHIGYATALVSYDALFEYDQGSLTVQFSDKSIGIVTAWLWEFGDDSISTDRNPTHIYNEEGTYTVTLAVSGPYGSDSFTQNVTVTVVGLFEIEDIFVPGDYVLRQNYPNPFNPSTTIEFSIPKSEFVTLKIYNLLGQKVATLVSEKLNAGSYNYSWDAGTLSSGVYLYKLNAGKLSQIRKMILLR